MKRAELPERIETERLVLRNRTLADAEAIFDFASRPEVSYPAGFPPVKTLEDEKMCIRDRSKTQLKAVTEKLEAAEDFTVVNTLKVLSN